MAKLSILEPLEAKEQTYEQQIKELQEKIENAKKMKDTVASERKQIEAELKKLPPILAKGIKNIEEKQAELAKIQEELDTLKQGWVEEAKKSKISDGLIEKLTKHKAPKTSNGGNKKLSSEEKQEAIIKAVSEGNDTLAKIQDTVGMSQNCQWRSKIPHFRRDKIPQVTILGKMPEVVKNVRNGGMVCVKRHVSTGNEHK